MSLTVEERATSFNQAMPAQTYRRAVRASYVWCPLTHLLGELPGRLEAVTVKFRNVNKPALISIHTARMWPSCIFSNSSIRCVVKNTMYQYAIHDNQICMFV